jgi:hypothetical protein
MIDATALGGVVGEGAAGSAELVVEGDAAGEGEESCGDAGAEVSEGAGTVPFECEEVFAGEEDRFDPLPDRRQRDPGVGLVLAGGSDDDGAELADSGLEVVAGVAFVADDRLAALQRTWQQGEGDVGVTDLVVTLARICSRP